MKKIKLFPLIIVICLVFTMWSPVALALEDPELNAKAAVLVDLNTGRVLFSKDMEAQRPMASLTKIMTGLLAVESLERGEHRMDEVVTAQADCQTGMDESSSNAGIVQGEQMSFQDVLYCALVNSANDACNVIASYLSGSIETFVQQMNQRAAELGCANTLFADPNGLSDDNHTTAYDLYLIASEAISHPDFMTICNTAAYTVPATNVNESREIANSNALISSGSVYGYGKYLYEYAAGVKTGYTRAAGYCLISTAEKDSIHTLAVVLGCDGWLNAGIEEYKNFDDSIKLYNWAFDNFSYKTILTTEDPITKVTVALSKDEGMAILRPQSDVTLLLPSDVDSSQVTTTATVYDEKLVAPIKAGTVLGEAQISINGEDYGTINLVNSTEIELSRGQYFKLKLTEVFTNGWVVAAIIIIILLLVVYFTLVARYRRMRREHLRQRRLAEQRRRAQREQLYKDMEQFNTPDDEPQDDPDWENRWK